MIRKYFTLKDGKEVEVYFDEKDEEQRRVDEYINSACPANWLEYAEKLFDSGVLLWKNGWPCTFDSVEDPVLYKKSGGGGRKYKKIKSSSNYQIFALLTGLAFENLFKGFHIVKDPNLILEGQFVDKAHHRLIDLVKGIEEEIQLNRKEQSVLKVLEEAIPFWGRYPIPKNHKINVKESIVTEDQYQLIVDLFDRISRKFYFLTKEGWSPKDGITSRYSSLRYEDKIE